ncbi:hypothetical protein L6Q21_14350 [Sandaracinobacter sp. RS1-74]|uniref:hypothetical protein n=1 Tax=Sandaracinobacteroides sayramensis TaxID=2913411 RepID=UPI001EDBC675|nr:hypothetical protein [Sandaracinobacteroides sayramensis]MCG2842163.1 hypothetical protein [Sandaracinobacteroides sayramensis]
MTSLLLRLAALALAPAAFAQPVPAQAGTGQLGVVPVRPQPPAEQEDWVATRSSSSGCIDVARIGGAVVIDSRNLDVVMRGGQRFRLTLAQSCPQLSYYGGFYYKPTQPGKFCAGRDRVMAREGGACRVSRISELKKAKPSRR